MRTTQLTALSLSLAWTAPAYAQSQAVLVNGNPVTTGADVAPAGTTYSTANFTQAVIAFVHSGGGHNIGLLNGTIDLAHLVQFDVANAVVRNTGGTCTVCHPLGGISVAQFGDKFVLAYPTNDSHIHVRIWTSATWPDPNPPDIDVTSHDPAAMTSYAPNLVPNGPSLFMTFRDDNNHIHVRFSNAGDFTDVHGFADLGDNQQSDWAPVLATANGGLWLGRQVGDPGCLINCKNPDLAVSNAGSTNEANFSDASMDNSGPGALGIGGNLFFSWRGQNNRNISYTQMTTGDLSNVLGQTTGVPHGVTVLSHGEQSEHTPNLASFGDVQHGFTVDLLWHDGNTSSTGSDGSNLLYEPIATFAPTPVTLCGFWNANYIDTALGEDVWGQGSDRQQIPASFANFSLSGPATLNGTLDRNGCVDITRTVLHPDGTLIFPSSATWTLTLNGTFSKPLHFSPGMVSINVFPTEGSPPVGEAVTATFNVTSGTSTILAVPTTTDAVTAVSGFVATALLREETDDIGLPSTSINIYAAEGCPDGNGGHSDNSCASATDNVLYIAPPITAQNNCPQNINIGDAHWKFIVAHEFGHVIQHAANAALYGSYNPQIAGRPAVCRCDHVTVANQLHCMQSTQRWNDAQEEGFAHFYSASIWNSHNSLGSGSCVFEYYKEFLVSDNPNLPPGEAVNIQEPQENPAPPLASPCDTVDGGVMPGDGGPGTFYSILPPLKVNCYGDTASSDPRSFVNYRQQAQCWTSGPADEATEFDWLKFYMTINHDPQNPAVTFPISQILGIYTNACSTLSPNTVTCASAPPPTSVGQLNWDLVQNLVASGAQYSSDQKRLFQSQAKANGVDRGI
jgi:hypothetical protein